MKCFLPRLFVAIRFAFTVSTIALTTCVSVVNAGTIFESGTLGPTGIPWSDLSTGTVPGARVDPNVYNGVRFHLSQPVVTSQIGGHFVAPSSGSFFGAIVALDNGIDFPDSRDLNTPDVLGHALLTFPVHSAEAFGDLKLTLNRGWYALVFGSGIFGATGSGGMPLNNPDLGEPSYIGFQPLSPADWLDLFPIFQNYRFEVSGLIIPEPSATSLILLASIVLFSKARCGLIIDFF